MIRARGFTLIDVTVAIAIIAIVAVFALPKMQDFSRQAKIESTRSAIGAVRSVLSAKYLNSARMGTSQASNPTSLVAADFPDGKLPVNQINGRSGVIAITNMTGTASTSATHASAGFWYVTSNNTAYGRSGAYSDGVIDTSEF